MSEPNPFAALAAPPAGEDPEAQLAYLEQVVAAFEAAGNPRLTPLKRKLHKALTELAHGAESGADPDQLARDFAGQVMTLRLQTYELLTAVLNQVRATLRAKLQGGLPAGERLDIERLQKGLGLYVQGLRKVQLAAKKGAPELENEGARLIAEAEPLLAASAKETRPDEPG